LDAARWTVAHPFDAQRHPGRLVVDPEPVVVDQAGEVPPSAEVEHGNEGEHHDDEDDQQSVPSRSPRC
jgi:hypothetical protein